mmetsp:Transcript_51447/g.82002  ORF Transcript_51447/g.82002 Transcript_51447/m.82002 type:complete len:263 (-) Transcript_51447:144-932(-)
MVSFGVSCSTNASYIGSSPLSVISSMHLKPTMWSLTLSSSIHTIFAPWFFALSMIPRILFHFGCRVPIFCIMSTDFQILVWLASVCNDAMNCAWRKYSPFCRSKSPDMSQRTVIKWIFFNHNFLKIFFNIFSSVSSISLSSVPCVSIHLRLDMASSPTSSKSSACLVADFVSWLTPTLSPQNSCTIEDLPVPVVPTATMACSCSALSNDMKSAMPFSFCACSLCSSSKSLKRCSPAPTPKSCPCLPSYCLLNTPHFDTRFLR